MSDERVETTEKWGLFVDGRTLTRGYSDRPLTSAEDVRKDFDAGLVDRGVVMRMSVTTTAYDPPPATGPSS